MISIASTKEVKTKGSIRVSHGQWHAMAVIKPIVERKNIIQYIPLDFFLASIIIFIWRKNRVDKAYYKLYAHSFWQEIFKPFTIFASLSGSLAHYFCKYRITLLP